MKSFFAKLLLAALTTAALSGFAQVRVVKSAGDLENPTLFISGISGNPQVAQVATDDLKNCGWFDVVQGNNADYTLQGAFSGSTLALVLRDASGSTVCTVNHPINAENVSHSVHQAVDEILKKVFKIPGLCATRIAFSAQTTAQAKNIFICDYDGKNIKQLTRHTSLCVEPEWFPDSKSVLFTMYGQSATSIIQTMINPYQSRSLVSMKGLNTGGSISPNGKFMALVMSQDNQVELYIKEVDSSRMKRLTNSKAVEASPCWSPDGSQICFVSDLHNGRQNLYVIGVGGGTPSRLNTEGLEATSPHWAKNGSIVYSARMGSNYALAIISKDPKVKSGIVTKTGGDWESPSWAPDSRHVVCSRKIGGKSSLYIVDTWTGKSRQLISGKFDMSFPSWSNPF